MSRFHNEMSRLAFRQCDACQEAWPSLRLHQSSQQCYSCHRDRETPKLFLRENEMVPGCLLSLTVVEELLIAQVMPMMNMYILRGGRIFFLDEVTT